MGLQDLLAVVFGIRTAKVIEEHEEAKAIQKDLRRRNEENSKQLEYIRSGQYGRDLEEDWRAEEQRSTALWMQFPEHLRVVTEEMLGPPPYGWPPGRPRNVTADAYHSPYAFLALLSAGDHEKWKMALAGEGDPRETPTSFAAATEWAYALRDADSATLEKIFLLDAKNVAFGHRFADYVERLELGDVQSEIHRVTHSRLLPSAAGAGSVGGATIEQRLTRIDELLLAGALTREEHAAKRAEILSRL